nr:gag pol polyprotein [Hymenolepis microstoma]
MDIHIRCSIHHYEMFTHSRDRILSDPSSYSARLKEHFRFIRPAPTRSNGRPTHMHKDLSSCPFVFVRVDRVKKPHSRVTKSNAKVQRQPKCIILDRNGTKDPVSIDRLKPAYLESPPTPASLATEVTVPPPSSPPPPPSPLQSFPEDASTPSIPTPVLLRHEPYYTRSGRRVTFPSRSLATSVGRSNWRICVRGF